MTLTPTGPCGARSSGPRPEDGKSRCNASPYSSTPAKLVALHEQPRRRLSKLCCITLFFFPLRVCATAESPLVSLPCVCLTPHPRSSSERPPSLFRWHGGLTEPPPMPHRVGTNFASLIQGAHGPSPRVPEKGSCAFQIGTLAAARAGGAGGGSRRSTPPRGEDREVGRVFEGPARDPKPRKGAEKKGRSGPTT